MAPFAVSEVTRDSVGPYLGSNVGFLLLAVVKVTSVDIIRAFNLKEEKK